MILHDTKGDPIEPGAVVAYNLSGDVVCGRVLSISRGGGNIKIEVVASRERFYPGIGHVSNVKNHRGVLVLRDAQGVDKINPMW